MKKLLPECHLKEPEGALCVPSVTERGSSSCTRLLQKFCYLSKLGTDSIKEGCHIRAKKVTLEQSKIFFPLFHAPQWPPTPLWLATLIFQNSAMFFAYSCFYPQLLTSAAGLLWASMRILFSVLLFCIWDCFVVPTVCWDSCWLQFSPFGLSFSHTWKYFLEFPLRDATENVLSGKFISYKMREDV